MFLNTRFFFLVLIIVLVLWKVSESNNLTMTQQRQAKIMLFGMNEGEIICNSGHDTQVHMINPHGFNNTNLTMISPTQEEIVLDEGDTVEIICSSDESDMMNVDFIYPNDFNRSPDSLRHIKKCHTKKNGVYEHILQRTNTVFEDTGWYGCRKSLYRDNNPHTKRIYVYIKSKTHFFLKTNSYVLNAVVGDDIVIPCRTTSPELVPTLYGNRKRSMYREEDEKMEKPFNPRDGFMMKNLTKKDSDFYRCSVEKDGIKQDIYYMLYVTHEILYEPKIDDNSFHATCGEDLNVDCTVQVYSSLLSNGLPYVFEWITPQQNNKRIKANEYYIYRSLDEKNSEITVKLTILNVTNEDAGEYECFLQLPAPFNSMRKTTKNITIHDIGRKCIKEVGKSNSVVSKTAPWIILLFSFLIIY